MEINEDVHEHPHHRLIEEIAERVEEKLVAKFAKWVIANGIALLAVLVGGIAAYYDVKHETKTALQNDVVMDYRMNEQSIEARTSRESIDRKLDAMNTTLGNKIDEIQRFLRDHNQATLNGLSGRNGK